jgi:ubiquitin carboxyl-terminal hydrolase 8
MGLCQSGNMRRFSHSRLQIGEGIRYGRVGLRNFGNTCFMNSCLQCLSSTVPLTSYFLQGFFEAEINIANPLGNRGSLPICYVMFIKAIWCQKEPVHTPDEIMSAVN